jgi:hypothetical protein
MPDHPIVGDWQQVHREESAEEGVDVTILFSPNGQLTYTIHSADHDQIILLNYGVEGDVLVTDQPSAPRQARTRFWFEGNETLVLEYEGSKAWYRRRQWPGIQA